MPLSRCRLLLLALLPFCPLFSEETPPQEVHIYLKDPLFQQGTLATSQGGVITAKNLRIQATHIEYTQNKNTAVHCLKAEGNLMIEKEGQVFVGKELTYDFTTHTGVLKEGKTFIDYWFIGGEKITFQDDGSYLIHNAYITSSENEKSLWEVKSSLVKISKEHLLTAKDLSFSYIKVPLLWIPSFKGNLKDFKDPAVDYKLSWDKGMGLKATMRYRLFSQNHFQSFIRADYRIKRGWGGALETTYTSPDERVSFLTKSYGAHDKNSPDEKRKKRFRLQGLYEQSYKNDQTKLTITYDRLSDKKMAEDFKSADFELNTQLRSRLFLSHQEDNYSTTLSIQPRLNSFQTLKQELPQITLGIRPFTLGQSKILSDNSLRVGFLDYAFAKSLHHPWAHKHALSLHTHNKLYRPIPLGPLVCTPQVTLHGRFYDNCPVKTPLERVLLEYGGQVHTYLNRQGSHLSHTIKPYLVYQRIQALTPEKKEPFIFDLTDGITSLNLMKLGIEQAFHKQALSPALHVDLYTYGYLSSAVAGPTFPKVYSTIEWNLPRVAVGTLLAWNLQHHVWDKANIRTAWTVNQNLAFSLEMRHRSAYNLRKASEENFSFEHLHSEEEALHSPLSDRRNTFLSRMHLRLSPRWTCHLQTHQGWHRKNEPSYHEEKIDLSTLLSPSWRLRLSYQHTPNDDRVSASIVLVK